MHEHDADRAELCRAEARSNAAPAHLLSCPGPV